MKYAFLLWIFIASCPVILGQSDCPSQTYTGTATYYSTAGSAPGACSFPTSENLTYICAVNSTQYNTAAMCGACLQVSGTLGQQIVYVVDEGNSLGTNALDMNQAAFEAIVGNANLGTGTVTWKVVSCPLASYPLELTQATGSNPWYLNYTIHRSVNPIDSVEVLISGIWNAMTRQSYNGWTAASFTPNNVTIADVRVTDIFGEKITIPNVDMTNIGVSYFATSNFTPCVTSNVGLDALSKSTSKVLYDENNVIIKSVNPIQSIAVFDLMGKEVYRMETKEPVQTYQINASQLAKGFYSLTMIEETGEQRNLTVVIR